MVGIYKITNIITGKVYIGSSVNILERIKKHFSNEGKNNKCVRLRNSLISHGLANFKYDVVEECLKGELVKKEQYWIDKFQSFLECNGYNILAKAYSSLGYKHTELSKQKISEIHKGKKLTNKRKKEISATQKLVIKTDKWNAKNSKAHMGNKNPMFGKETSECQKISVALANKKRVKLYILINPLGEIVSFYGLTDFCKSNSLNPPSISQLNNGVINTYKGWTKSKI